MLYAIERQWHIRRPELTGVFEFYGTNCKALRDISREEIIGLLLLSFVALMVVWCCGVCGRIYYGERGFRFENADGERYGAAA